MSNNLPLAVDIADTAKEGDLSPAPLAVGKAAVRLNEAHPEAKSTEADIAHALRETSETPTAE